MSTNQSDPRWGGYIPFFLRHKDVGGTGDFDTFFDRVAHRLQQAIILGECGTTNPSIIGHRLESESHQRFRFGQHPSLDQQVLLFFSPASIRFQVDRKIQADQAIAEAANELERVRQKFKHLDVALYAQATERDPEFLAAQKKLEDIIQSRRQVYWQESIIDRLMVLETFLRLVRELPEGLRALPEIRRGIRVYLAETLVPYDITAEDPMRIVPVEEALLQKEVLDQLLPRLSSK